MNTDFDVVIIGGGGAGIGAARTLAVSGRSTLLLEASSRLGGRAWASEIAEQRLDLGCGWLHSADRNSWTRIAEEAGFSVDRRRPAWGVQYRNLNFSPGEQRAASGHSPPGGSGCLSRRRRVTGAYSYALPGRAAARRQLACPFDDRLFFAGEATNGLDFSTAHGAHDSRVRAAQEALAALQAKSGGGPV